ncbi:hypothetical protein FQN54_000153 [Arachnomyces sp. PD_36]|nr:hypothetical protein FQN54_000153 [Arachnomyces sp. PD_36]
MGGKKSAGENSKKAAGNAKKAENAAQKLAADNAKKAAEDDKEWSKGSKSNAKKYVPSFRSPTQQINACILTKTPREQADAKKAEAARKKADRDALLAAEEETQKAKPKSSKAAPKKSKGTLDLGDLDNPSDNKKGAALHATGIDNALDALSLSSNPNSQKVERHPERRFKAAYAAFEARRLPEIEKEQPGLRRQQRVDIARKEFEKHEDNPFNQVSVAFDASKEEIAGVKAAERAKIESRLTKK